MSVSNKRHLLRLRFFQALEELAHAGAREHLASILDEFEAMLSDAEAVVGAEALLLQSAEGRPDGHAEAQNGA